MEERDRNILQHFMRFRISTPHVIRTLFFADSPAAYAPVMDRLRNKKGLIKSFRVLKDNRSYHQLTRQAVSEMGLPESYAKPLGRQALLTHMGILWFCTMNRRNRTFVPDNASLAPLYGGVIPPGHHCMESQDRRRVYHLYVVMPDTKRDNLFKTIQEHLNKASALSALADRIEHREYGFAILVNTDTKREVVERFLRGKLTDDRYERPLAARAHFCVECVPDFEKGLSREIPTPEIGNDNAELG